MSQQQPATNADARSPIMIARGLGYELVLKNYDLSRDNMREVIVQTREHCRGHQETCKAMIALQKEYLDQIRIEKRKFSKANRNDVERHSRLLKLSGEKVIFAGLSERNNEFIAANLDVVRTLEAEHQVAMLELQEAVAQCKTLEDEWAEQLLAKYEAVWGEPFPGTRDEYSVIPSGSIYPDECCGHCEQCIPFSDLWRLVFKLRSKLERAVQERKKVLKQIEKGEKPVQLTAVELLSGQEQADMIKNFVDLKKAFSQFGISAPAANFMELMDSVRASNVEKKKELDEIQKKIEEARAR